jgi:phage-related protein
MKPVEFLGDALDALKAFPRSAQREAGFQLDKVQRGLDPDDWKPMNSVGPGVREIRVRDESGAFRVIYYARLSSAVYVLHCFQKKARKTSGQDIKLAQARYKTLMRRRP